MNEATDLGKPLSPAGPAQSDVSSTASRAARRPPRPPPTTRLTKTLARTAGALSNEVIASTTTSTANATTNPRRNPVMAARLRSSALLTVLPFRLTRSSGRCLFRPRARPGHVRGRRHHARSACFDVQEPHAARHPGPSRTWRRRHAVPRRRRVPARRCDVAPHGCPPWTARQASPRRYGLSLPSADTDRSTPARAIPDLNKRLRPEASGSHETVGPFSAIRRRLRLQFVRQQSR